MAHAAVTGLSEDCGVCGERSCARQTRVWGKATLELTQRNGGDLGGQKGGDESWSSALHPGRIFLSGRGTNVAFVKQGAGGRGEAGLERTRSKPCLNTEDSPLPLGVTGHTASCTWHLPPRGSVPMVSAPGEQVLAERLQRRKPCLLPSWPRAPRAGSSSADPHQHREPANHGALPRCLHSAPGAASLPPP